MSDYNLQPMQGVPNGPLRLRKSVRSHTRAWVATWLLVVLPGAAPWAQAAEAWAGVWKLNVERSKYDLTPAPRSGVTTLELTPDGWRLTADGIDARGLPTRADTRVRFDGRDYPIGAAANVIVTWAFSKIDDYTYEMVTKANGNVTSTTRTVISQDRNTRTSTTPGRTAAGEELTNVAVFDRQ